MNISKRYYISAGLVLALSIVCVTGFNLSEMRTRNISNVNIDTMKAISQVSEVEHHIDYDISMALKSSDNVDNNKILENNKKLKIKKNSTLRQFKPTSDWGNTVKYDLDSSVDNYVLAVDELLKLEGYKFQSYYNNDYTDVKIKLDKAIEVSMLYVNNDNLETFEASKQITSTFSMLILLMAIGLVILILRFGKIDVEQGEMIVESALVINNKNNDIKQLVYIDPVTNMMNRHSLKEKLLEKAETNENEEFTVGLIILDDADKIKLNYGYDFADAVIAHIAEILSKHFSYIKAYYIDHDLLAFIADTDDESVSQYISSKDTRQIEEELNKTYVINNVKIEVNTSIITGNFKRTKALSLSHIIQELMTRKIEKDKDMELKQSKGDMITMPGLIGHTENYGINYGVNSESKVSITEELLNKHIRNNPNMTKELLGHKDRGKIY